MLPLSYMRRVRQIQPGSLFLLTPLDEITGSTLNDYSITKDNQALGGGVLNQGTHLGRPYASSTATIIDGTATLISNCDYNTGTYMCWLQVESSTSWDDNNFRVAMKIYSDDSNSIGLEKTSSTGGGFRMTREVSSGTLTASVAPITTTDFFCAVCTWSNTNNSIELWIDGISQDSTICPINSSSVVSDVNVGGDKDTNFRPWRGFMQYSAFWSVVLSDDEIKYLSKVS